MMRDDGKGGTGAREVRGEDQVCTLYVPIGENWLGVRKRMSAVTYREGKREINERKEGQEEEYEKMKE